MQGAGLAKDLKPPYTEKHDRIRIWANGRWETFVPIQRHGPGVSFAHQLADFWPDDTIGIIKVAVGGTGIRGFEKNCGQRCDHGGRRHSAELRSGDQPRNHHPSDQCRLVVQHAGDDDQSD